MLLNAPVRSIKKYLPYINKHKSELYSHFGILEIDKNVILSDIYVINNQNKSLCFHESYILFRSNNPEKLEELNIIKQHYEISYLYCNKIPLNISFDRNKEPMNELFINVQEMFPLKLKFKNSDDYMMFLDKLSTKTDGNTETKKEEVPNIKHNDKTETNKESAYNIKQKDKTDKLRKGLYNNFKSYMEEYNVNLVTVECVIGENEFEITEENKPFDIRVKAEQILWLKENLINIGIKHLPKTWKYVVWLDADIEFLEDDWVEKIVEAFQKYDFIQTWRYAQFLGPDNTNIHETYTSFMYHYLENLTVPAKMGYDAHNGFGWGLTRKGYETIGKIIDYVIGGFGDVYMGLSLVGRLDEVKKFTKQQHTQNLYDELKSWDAKAKILRVNSRIGYANLGLKHYFHGYQGERFYGTTLGYMNENKFDPTTDIYYNDYGVIQLKQKKEKLIKSIEYYFNQRNNRENFYKN
jgi:hypothetical protein